MATTKLSRRLVERALTLRISDPHERLGIQVELGNSMLERGRLVEAAAVLDAVRDEATALGERGIVALALLYRNAQRSAR